jgi:soluble lytic murein transglycosylase-like protein
VAVKQLRRIWLVWGLAFGLLLNVPPSAAEIFKYLDREGNPVFSDEPMTGPYKLVWRSGGKKKARAASRQAQADLTTYKKGLSGYGVWKSRAKSAKVRTAGKSKKNMAALMLWSSSGRGVYVPRKGSGSVDYTAYRANLARYSSMIDSVARKNRLYPELLHAVVRAESAYDPNAISRAGAVGLMQLMPETAKQYGVFNRRNPKANVQGGARLLRYLLTKYRNNLKLALAAYNAGETNVEKYGNKVPPFPETQNYVRKVISYYRQNRRRSQSLAMR